MKPACLWLALLAAAPSALAERSAAPESLASAASALARELADGLARNTEKVSKVAVVSFGKGGDEAADAVAARLAERLTVIDRSKVSSAETAKAAGAHAVLTGSVSDTADGLLVEVRVVSVVSGAVLASARRTVARAGEKRVAAAVESAAVEVAMRRIADGLATAFERLPGSARYRRLAVLPFDELGETAQKRQLGTLVAAEVTTVLRRDYNFLLVERARLTAVMGELRVQQSGAVDSSSAAEIGKLSDAQALVIGSAADAGDHYLIDARIVATETGETLATSSTSVPATNMLALASDAAVLRSKKDAAFRSVLIPGWGQFYNREPLKGGLILGAEAALFAGALAFHFSGQQSYSDYTRLTGVGQLGSDPTGRARSLYDTTVSRYQTRNALLYVAGGLWVINVLDAWFSGVDGDALLGTRTIRF